MKLDQKHRGDSDRSITTGNGVDVLMYHSISHDTGPTSIPPEIYRGQIEVLAECGYSAVSMQDFADWLTNDGSLPPLSVIITFDDGFADFAEHAFPPLKAKGWTATVYLPTGKLGGVEDWSGANDPPRRLLNWEQVEMLARRGIDFGGHSIDHADLTGLSADQLECQVRECRDEIERRIGRAPISFAPPYGKAGKREHDEIRQWYRVSVGTRLQRAARGCDPYDVPRIEMHYFRDLNRWRNYLQRRDKWYFQVRRALRYIKQTAMQG